MTEIGQNGAMRASSCREIDQIGDVTMTECSPGDLDLLRTLDAYASLGGRPLKMPGATTRGEQRLVEAGLAEVRGERLCITRAGIDELRTREVAP